MTLAGRPPARRALALHVTGVVQGVGFRPFVHRLAVAHGLTGWVRNEVSDVVITAEGPPAALRRFVTELRRQAPPLARIDTVRERRARANGHADFTIAPSGDAAPGRQPVSPDVAICAACEAELRDPASRRFAYPFITCTDCGPRHSVIEGVPYDRARTSMRRFRQCDACAREYADIGDRRYHSETNSCPDCGPRAWLETADGGRLDGSADAIAAAARALAGGAIVAVQGVGGFHLAVDAANDFAVRRLRQRKHRDGKPLAVMVRDLAEARRLALLTPEEERWLTSPERPIVIARRRATAPVAASVCGPLDTIGIFLPATPLHMLLLDAVERPLVMTSGNPSHAPLAADCAEAREALGGIADAFLMHDREIVARTDDSVLRVAGTGTIILRRARGFAPLPVRLPVAAARPILGVGAHLKNTLALGVGQDAYVSQHLGDLETEEVAVHWRRTLAAMRGLFDATPCVVAHDLHPGYLSTQLAAEVEADARVVVQHHHAHVAAVAAEHGISGRVVGLAFDGTGHGDDGATWGAEFLVADLVGYRRAGHLRYAPLPGGDAAARLPWRVAAGYLALEPHAAPAFSRAFAGIAEGDVTMVRRQAAVGVNAPLASSAGRLFDAAAAVLGVCHEQRFEGEAAMRLEALAGGRRGRELPLPSAMIGGVHVLDPLPLLTALGEHAAAGDAGQLAADFHESLAAAAVRVAAAIAADEGIECVVLGGGVFQNARLVTSVRQRLEARGLRVLTARALPPNDGAIAYGQVAVAAARLFGAG